METSINGVVRILGKMCQQCAKCQDGMEKGMLFAAIGEAFLKYEDYFASSCEREYLNLQKEYNQYERFLDEASEACFECNGAEEFVYAHAKALMAGLLCKTSEEKHSTAKLAQISDFASKGKNQ